MEKVTPWGMELKVFLTLLHLSQLAGFVVPGAGLILPIVMWVMNKDLHDDIDQHGKIVVNWIISAIIYAIVSAILTLILIGVIGLIAVGILSIVFAIIGAVKAQKGEAWHYPLTIKFIK